ncbi:homeobox-leucine zipper protein anthocyaninless 2 [Phtheirospermum japonicum]|uniref:Homeobox-leucine zipper protein anthocyaninless 2 n=1 Tax=Phtheirospermum japonicum TaxID=374723 RepID=A0A830C060_9LAMI|nr:homeobox-leucine zipper protein anthocyaninless 2 [Phtheirospermum japonicum]
MVADGLCSYNIMSTTGPMSQPLQMLHSSHSQPLFNSPPLSLALQPKMENLGDMGLIRDELESRSGSDNLEAASGDDLNTSDQKKPSKRKKYHRHTTFQIQELEASFKDNPHPDEKGRLELGKRLGLEVRQVKFWFQNRRTQMKTQLERHENSILKQENDKLRIENITMKEAMRSPMCENCGCPAILGEIPIEQHHLMIENARLKDELNRLGILASKFLTRTTNGPNPKLDLAVGRNGFSGMMSSVDPSMSLGLDFGNKMSSPFHANVMSGDVPFDKSCFLELALAAMDELMKLGQIDSPLWFGSLDGTGESLNLDEYVKTFRPCIGEKPSHFETEATRAIGSVMISGLALVETFMDVNQWTEMFPWNIGRASILDVISPGVSGNRNCALQLMEAEFQILSPLVPVRQIKFIRFCKQHREDMWAVVDVSVDALFQGIRGNASSSCWRLPSGCIVQDMPNGYSKVTWIEHTEYDENIVHHLYRPLLRSGMILGAQKWLTNLQRQCELFAMIMSSVASGDDHSALHPSGKKSIVKLAQRMTRSFCTGVCATVHKWEVVQNCDNTKLMMRKSIGNSGEPPGVILSATTTVWMPISPQQLLDFLQDEKTRCHWDVLSQDGPMQQMLRVPKGQDLGNDISLLRTSTYLKIPASNSNPNGMLILQETCTDASGSLIVHAAVETAAMTVAMNGGDSSSVAILPSGFAIVPDCFPDSGTPGSLLTLGFQILVNNLPAAQLTMESVDTVKSLIARTIQGIKSGLQCD